MAPQHRALPSDADLDPMQWAADPHADDTVTAIVGTLRRGANALEDRITTHGTWEALERHQP